MKNNGDEKVREIIIRQGEENRARIGNIYQESNFFKSAYEQAAKVVSQIVDSTNAYYKRDKQKKYANENTWGQSGLREEHFSYIDAMEGISGFPNNMIVFSAERGEGKTSAMLSFTKALAEVRVTHETNRAEVLWSPAVRTCNFNVLQSVDPTVMERKDSVLRIILSRMFWKFRQCAEDYRHMGTLRDFDERTRRLTELFQKCYRSIDVLKQTIGAENIYDDLYYLSELGDCANTKATFFALVKEYLKYHYSQQDIANCYLVVQIDDVDLNTQPAYDILEDCRKYLMMPNVILIFAASLPQLRDVITCKFVGDFELLSKSGQKYMAMDYYKMSEQYIEKIFPIMHQIHLSRIGNLNLREEELRVSYFVEKECACSDEWINILEYENTDEQEMNYQQILLRYIYEKTGIILVAKSHLHEILPRKMRELTHFLAYMNDALYNVSKLPLLAENIEECYKLDQGEDVSMEQQEVLQHAFRVREKNIKAFEEYLMKYWCEYYLRESKEVLQVICKEPFPRKIELMTDLINENDKKKENEDTDSLHSEHGGICAVEDWIAKRIETDAQQEVLFSFLEVIISVNKNQNIIRSLRKSFMLESLEDTFGTVFTGFSVTLPGIYGEVRGGKISVDESTFGEWIDKMILDKTDSSYISRCRSIYIREEEGVSYFNIFGPFTELLQVMQRREALYIDSQQHKRGKMLASILQIILNPELKQEVQKRLHEVEWNVEDANSPNGIMKKIYEEIDEAVRKLTYLKLDSCISEIITEDKVDGTCFFDIAFLSNSEFEVYYFNILKKRLLSKFETLTKINLDARKSLLSMCEDFISKSSPCVTLNAVKPSDYLLDDRLMEGGGRIVNLINIWNGRRERVLSIYETVTVYFAAQIGEDEDEDGEEKKEIPAPIQKELKDYLNEQCDAYNQELERWKAAVEACE